MSASVSSQAAIGPNARHYDDFRVGETWKTARRTITEADLLMFAGLTGDYNPIHTDELFAKSTPFGGRILHGPAGFAIATGLESRLGLKDGTAIAFLGMTWDMTGPIKIGDTIHVDQTVTSMRETKKPTTGIVFFNVKIVNQRDEVVQQGEWKVMFFRKVK